MKEIALVEVETHWSALQLTQAVCHPAQYTDCQCLNTRLVGWTTSLIVAQYSNKHCRYDRSQCRVRIDLYLSTIVGIQVCLVLYVLETHEA